MKRIFNVGMIVSMVISVMSFAACSNPDTEPTKNPELTSLTPDALTWDADDTDAKTIAVAGKDMNGAEITLSKLNKFTATISGTTITVVPATANTADVAVVEELVVSVKGGNSLKATLTHSKPEAEPEPLPTPGAPSLTSLTPDALSWAAVETDAKTIEVEGENIEDAVIKLSALTKFTASVSGNTITVTPKSANDTQDDVVETLTVSVDGGNSLEATLTQTKPEAVPVPNLTSLAPDALSWAADQTDAKTITVTGENLEGLTLTLSALTNFTASVQGTTVTVAPKAANAGETDVTETLIVSVEGGNSLTATLTQTKPEAEPGPEPTPAGVWKKVTENRDDWSGTYLFVAEVEPHNPRMWNNELVSATVNKMWFVTVVDNCITSAGTVNMGRDPEDGPVTNNGDIALSDLGNYSVKIAKVDGGYSIQIPQGYITNTSGVAGTEISESPVVAATTITMSDDHTFWIEKTTPEKTTTRFGWFNNNRVFNYFPENRWNDKSQISLYEYVTE